VAEEDGALPTVSLVVAIRNEAAHIARCLDSMSRQDYPAHLLEIIVVDGDSTDETVELARRAAERDPRIQLLRNPQREMPYALNIGIEAATGAYIGSVIGHATIPSDYVRRAVEAMERTGAWAVGGRYVRKGATPTQRAIAIATSSPIGVGDSSHNYATTAGWAETAFPGFWRREVFDRVGPFDPHMLVNEDNELAYRIRKAGGGLWYEPEIAVAYVSRPTLRALFHQYRRYAVGKVRVLRKHRGGLRWRHLVPAVWVAALVIGGALAPFIPLVRLPWAAAVGLYAAVVVVAGMRLREPGVEWWRIAGALVTLHVAYGIGTWQGVAGLIASPRR